jgi:hypothetical protein
LKKPKALFGAASKPKKAKVGGNVRTNLAEGKKPKTLYGKLGAVKKVKK